MATRRSCPAGTFDVIVYNCLYTDKGAVLEGIQRLLKPGGTFYFPDVYADRRVPETVLYGECLGGTLYWNDFLSIATKVGVTDPRLVEDRPLEITDPELAAQTGDLNFFSATYRLFKIDELESACEDFGQSVVYRGSISNLPETFALDKYHNIESGKPFPVCGNTWRMLHDSRFSEHFDFNGDFSHHPGLFTNRASSTPDDKTAPTKKTNSCC